MSPTSPASPPPAEETPAKTPSKPSKLAAFWANAKHEVVIICGLIVAVGDGLDLTLVPNTTIRTVAAIVISVAGLVIARNKVLPLSKLERLIPNRLPPKL